jgi:ATP-dependent DNA ligase
MLLPDPMLAKPGPLPTSDGWSYEPKWDGFRAIVRSGEN